MHGRPVNDANGNGLRIERGHDGMQVERMDGNAGLTALFEAHRAELLRFLTARCGDPDHAEDLLQELWIKSMAVDQGPIANGRAYLFRMANNLVLDRRRSEQRAMRRNREWLLHSEGGDMLPEHRPDPTPRADEELERQQEAGILRSAIAALPPGAGRALRLHRLEGHPQAEVADIMGISRSGVEKHLAVAMRHLRNALANCGSFSSVPSDPQGQPTGELPPPGEQP